MCVDDSRGWGGDINLRQPNKIEKDSFFFARSKNIWKIQFCIESYEKCCHLDLKQPSITPKAFKFNLIASDPLKVHLCKQFVLKKFFLGAIFWKNFFSSLFYHGKLPNFTKKTKIHYLKPSCPDQFSNQHSTILQPIQPPYFPIISQNDMKGIEMLFHRLEVNLSCH